MELKALGYVGVGASSINSWKDFAVGMLGMQLGDRTSHSAGFRMDEREQRLFIDSEIPDGSQVLGWEVSDGAALEAIAQRLEAAGVRVRWESTTLATRRHVSALISFHDPVGNRLEIFHGAAVASTPFAPGRAISGFRTGSLGLGHAVLTVERTEAVLPFYQDVLGFRLSDFMLRPFKAHFLHVNSRHHSLALIETGRNGMHHLMVELLSIDDVGQGYDIALCNPEVIGVTLGRHINDYMTSFYAKSPSPFMVEYGWGGRALDLKSWEATEVTQGASFWGHERSWLSPEARQHAKELRMQAARDGQRAPVQVLNGNYTLFEEL
ncbi:VOC family protein [Paraburkholderia caribensis]|uniref:VOC family protein n=1 Tax=Paraburkholderia caribensis TaxID=75105 RepID=UPI001CAC15BB|nr:VOC family protein [Paraburkholderia caribensis]CAG9263060.1 Biphenyl-2,3-diol 1,2-dioxygenase [Paraburkholderia caribensis]